MKIISIQSFRRGTGKTTLAVNLATVLAGVGKQTIAIDANLYYPALHAFFNLDESNFRWTFNDFCSNQCEIERAVYPVHPTHSTVDNLYLIPARQKISPALGQPPHIECSFDSLHEGLSSLSTKYQSDVIILDNQAGITEDTLLTMAEADTLVVLVRNDKQDFQGTAVLVDVARKLEIPRIMMIANQIPEQISATHFEQELRKTYGCDEVLIIPYNLEILALSSNGQFVLDNPNHPITRQIQALAWFLTS